MNSKPAPDELNDRLPDYAEHSLPPADAFDPVLEAYKQDVDRTLLREHLKLTPRNVPRNWFRSCAGSPS